MADICYLLFWQWTVQLTPTSMQKVCKESIYEENVPLQLSSVLFNEMSVNTTKPHFVWHDMILLLNFVFKLYNCDIYMRIFQFNILLTLRISYSSIEVIWRSDDITFTIWKEMGSAEQSRGNQTRIHKER